MEWVPRRETAKKRKSQNAVCQKDQTHTETNEVRGKIPIMPWTPAKCSLAPFWSRGVDWTRQNKIGNFEFLRKNSPKCHFGSFLGKNFRSGASCQPKNLSFWPCHCLVGGVPPDLRGAKHWKEKLDLLGGPRTASVWNPLRVGILKLPKSPSTKTPSKSGRLNLVAELALFRVLHDWPFSTTGLSIVWFSPKVATTSPPPLQPRRGW